MRSSRSLLLVAFLVPVLYAASMLGQSTGSATETVNQRNTLGVLTASPTSGVTAGSTVTFSYILNTGGAPAPTSETVQFMNGGSALGSPQAITSVSGSNLLIFSQINTGNGWTLTGTVPTVTPNAATGPDGSSNSATTVAFPSTTSGTSGVQMAVTGTAYAGLPLTLSVWAESASPTTLTLKLTDSPALNASNSNTCAVTSSWQRCTFTYTYPGNAGTGFAASFISTGQSAQTISLWGAQVEQASSAGPYVSTIGTARATGGAGGSVSFPYSLFMDGTQNVSVVYGGDSNFVGSTSNTVSVAVGKATPGMTLTSTPASPSNYGQSITFTATLTGPSGNPSDLPTGSINFLDGATVIGTGALSSGVATLTLSGTGSLGAGSHSITAVYAGSSEFNGITSTALPYVVAKVSSSVTVTVTSSLNPSIYGDSVKFSVTVASSIGAAIPTGTITLTDGGNSLGTINLDGTGAGSLTVPLLTAGSHTILATYSGDGNYN